MSITFDAQHLLNYKVEDVRQSYTASDSAFYALSVGMGHDPLDVRRLAFVDPAKGPSQLVLPSMALVLGYPGFWFVRPDTTVDPTRILHGSQAIEWHRPLPPEGDVIGKTRMVRLVDRGAGKHAMAVSERLVIDAATGEPYATLTQTHVLRGHGGFGGDPGPLRPPHEPPQAEPKWQLDIPTLAEQALLYRLNGDLFPLHSDPEMARRSGFPRPILHGMCVAGIATQALMGLIAENDPAWLRSIEMRFAAPAFPGEILRVEAWTDGSFQLRALERNELILSNGLVKGP